MRTRSLFLAGLLTAALAASCSLYEPDSVLGDTRVRIALGENGVKDRWDGGEQVSAFAMDGTRPVASYVFTTQGRGPAAEFRCPTGVAETSDYRFLYPADGTVTLGTDGIRGTVPVRQEPVQGSLAPELLLSSGRTGSLEEEVRLKPLVALVKFTLVGGGAESVVKATLSCSSPLSGSIVFYDTETVESAFYDVPAYETNPTNYIEMAGRFTSGGTYYAAAVPGATDATVQISLQDGTGGQHDSKVEHVTLRAGEVTDLGTVYLGPSLIESGDFFPIMTATKGEKPIVLAFVPDGFVDGVGANSREEYVKACREGAAYIFNVEPYKSMRDYFTVYVSWKAADEPGVGKTFGTKLGQWYENYLGLPASARNDICNFVQDRCPEILDGTIRPAELGMFLVVNGRKNYGAVCEWTESRAENEGRFVALVDYTGEYQWGSLPVGVVPAQWGGNTDAGALEARTDENGNTYTYTLTEFDFKELGYVNYSGSAWGYLNTWKNTLLHEGAGHGFGRLQDEYWFSTTPYPYKTVAGHEKNPRQAMNMSASATDYPWKNLMDLRDELIQRDPRYARIGMFQGGMANYFSGIWRPERTSAMNDMRPYFGAWDRALIYERIMRLSGVDPDFDVVNSVEDLKAFLEHDIAHNGNYDPLRDKTVR